MRKIILFIIGIFLTILAIKFMVDNLNNQSMDQVQNYKIFSETDALPMSIEDEQRYTPSDQDIQSGLKILNNQLKNETTIRDLAEYNMRFFGYKNKTGEKILWADCFCNTFNGDWQDSSVGVDGGGNCFFQIKINLDKEEVFDLQVNDLY